MIRYEGLFLVFVICCLFVVKREPFHALLLGGASILPIATYGLVSVSKGWYVIPNSILLKGNMPDLSSFGDIVKSLGLSGYQQLQRNQSALMLILGNLVVLYFRFIKDKKIWKDSILMMIIFISTTFLHMQFAKIGWFYRYEAYLISLGVLVIGLSLTKGYPIEFRTRVRKQPIFQYIVLAFLIFFIVSPLVIRGRLSLVRIPQASKNIYEQQYQIGLFLKKFYQGGSVAANDIGAINHLADIRCLDLWGLGNLNVASAKMRKRYNGGKIYEFAKSERIQIAIIYDHWFEVPSQWVKVGQWKILDNVICGGDTVSFYAVNPMEKNILIRNLQKFSSFLPKGVTQSGMYMDANLEGRA